MAVVQTAVDGREHCGSLLDQRLGRPNWGVGVDIGDLFLGCGDHALGRLLQKSHQLEQNRAGRVERHGEGDLPDVIHARSAFDLHNLSHIHRLALARYTSALELEHGRGIVDVGGVQKRPQRACECRRQPSTKVRQANSVGSAPWDELEFDHPVQFGHGVVALFPVTVQANDFGLHLVDHQDVRGRFTLGTGVVFQFQPCVDVENPADAVFVVLKLLALDLFVGFFGVGLLWLNGSLDVVGVPVQARGDTALEFPVRDVLHLGHTL